MRTEGSWMPTMMLRLAGLGCCTQDKDGAVTQQDGAGQPTFAVHKNLAVVDQGSMTVIRHYKKGDKFFGVERLSTGHAIRVAKECWVGRWDRETGAFSHCFASFVLFATSSCFILLLC